MSPEGPPPLAILLVEDNPGDVELIRRALDAAGLPCRVRVAGDGDAALAALLDGPRPDLVLLDLNLPGADGWEVLRRIKRDERLSAIPVVVLSSSDAEADVRGAYRLHASAYMVKPPSLDRFSAAMQALAEYWSHTVRLPR